MKKLSIILIALLLIPYALPASDEKIVPLYEGDTAPFDGLLVPEDRFDKFLKAEANEDLLNKELEFKDYEVKLEQEFCDKKIDVCMDELNKCREVVKRKWYEKPGLYIVTGTVIGLGIAYGAAWSWGQVESE